MIHGDPLQLKFVPLPQENLEGFTGVSSHKLRSFRRMSRRAGFAVDCLDSFGLWVDSSPWLIDIPTGCQFFD